MNKSKNSTSITVSTSDYIQTLLRGVTPTADRKRQDSCDSCSCDEDKKGPI